MNSFHAEIHKLDEESIVIKINGEFEGMDAMNYEAELMRQLELAPKRLILELSDAKYIDSAAISILTKLTINGRRNGKQVILLKPSEFILKVLFTAKLDQLLTISEKL